MATSVTTNGNLIAKAKHENEDILIAQCDLGLCPPRADFGSHAFGACAILARVYQ